ncbi:MAG: hypothetical protein JRN33_04730 [Nitrososphaerota archaeon]|jgi:hypothetical protein|nr:hypothetical protein [Nitrososphaerota archaeon]
MRDFDDALTEVCRSVLLEVLGERGRHSTSWWLARSGVSMADCARKPEEFDDALVELFQPMGALILEARILSRFYRSQGKRYQRTDSLSFADEVGRARSLFGAAPADSFC